ncbi:MAG: hypothetical protein QOG06_77, partial [Gaiellaceae bacterium]|nr:hypothetical protein [Gaiellaceae bacterium]
MATRTTEPRDLIEQWKAEHPELSNGSPPAPRERPRPARAQAQAAAPLPSPSAPVDRAAQRAMIERWSQEHPELTGGRAPVRTPDPPTRTYERPAASDRRVIELASTPLTVLSAFVIGCIIGGIV